MTTTPLPPLAKSTPEQDELFDHLYEYGVSAEGVHQRIEKVCQAYAQQARADLEAENKRLRVFVMQVLKGCLTGRIKSPPIVIEDLEATDLKLISLGDAARAALEKQHG